VGRQELVDEGLADLDLGGELGELELGCPKASRSFT
jgi:hypothetical protein